MMLDVLEKPVHSASLRSALAKSARAFSRGLCLDISPRLKSDCCRSRCVPRNHIAQSLQCFARGRAPRSCAPESLCLRHSRAGFSHNSFQIPRKFAKSRSCKRDAAVRDQSSRPIGDCAEVSRRPRRRGYVVLVRKRSSPRQKRSAHLRFCSVVVKKAQTLGDLWPRVNREFSRVVCATGPFSCRGGKAESNGIAHKRTR